MKKQWTSPRILVQKFEANEYVAACYMLACHRGPNDDCSEGDFWNGREYGPSVSHSPLGTPGTCGDASANRVITDDGGLASSVGEFNKDEGWLSGGIDYIVQKDGNGTLDPGDVVFWHTEQKLGIIPFKRWNHWGYVQQQDPSHPNHS